MQEEQAGNDRMRTLEKIIIGGIVAVGINSTSCLPTKEHRTIVDPTECVIGSRNLALRYDANFRITEQEGFVGFGGIFYKISESTYKKLCGYEPHFMEVTSEPY